MYFKSETAGKANVTDPGQLEQQKVYYRYGNGDQRYKRYLAKMTPEELKERRAKAMDWKRRNYIRVRVARIASNSKARATKRNPVCKSHCQWKLVGCNVIELQSVIESMFTDGMSWSNTKEWDVDHVKPLRSFDLRNMTEVYQCLHFSNLQLLWKPEHYAKNEKDKLNLSK